MLMFFEAAWLFDLLACLALKLDPCPLGASISGHGSSLREFHRSEYISGTWRVSLSSLMCNSVAMISRLSGVLGWFDSVK